jgi:hypothetical protein
VVLDALRIVTLPFIRVAEVPVRPALHRPVAHLLCNRQALLVELDRLAEIPLRLVRVAEVRVRRALPRPVAHLLGHFQVLLVVLERLGKVPQRLVRVAEGAIHPRSLARHGSPHGGCDRPGRALLRCHAPPVGSYSKLL